MTFAYILQIKGGRVRLRCKMIIMCKVWIKVYASNYLHLQKMEEKKVNYIIQKQTNYYLLLTNLVLFALISFMDDALEKFFPIPYMEASEVSGQTGEKEAKECRKSLRSLKIAMGKERTIFLNPIELEGCNLSTLGILDMHGKFWQASNS